MNNERNNAPAVPQGEPVAWLDLSKMSASAMVYATGWKSNDKQSPLYTASPSQEPAQPIGLPQGITTSQDDGKWRVTLAFDSRLDAEALRAYMDANGVPTVNFVSQPSQEPDDKAMLEVIDERDRCHEWADQLADAIAKHTGYEIGEHTSANNPWRMALNALVCHEAKPAQEVGLTDDALDNLIEDLSEWSRHVVEDTARQTLEAHIREVLANSAIIAALREKEGK